eukprot:SAG22_NODE_10927_length_509_cov_1.039024_1_plen_60_part_01
MNRSSPRPTAMREYGLLPPLFAAAVLHAPWRTAALALELCDPTMQLACGAARRVSAGSCL